MSRLKFLFFVIFLSLVCLPGISGFYEVLPNVTLERNDTIDIQVLYNGRAWRNLYYRIKGDQFLFSNEFLPGKITIDGKTFDNLQVKYDIYNDELILNTDYGFIIQINKEMTDFFSMKFDNKIYYFKKLVPDSLNSLSGYVNVVYDGNIELYIKYRKEILHLAGEDGYDLFNQISRIYAKKDGMIIRIDSKGKLMSLLKDRKHEINTYARKNRIWVSKNDPESFKKVIEFYEKLQTSNY